MGHVSLNYSVPLSAATRHETQLSPGENAPGIASARQLRCAQILFTGLLALFETRAWVLGLDLLDYSPSVNEVNMHTQNATQPIRSFFPRCSVTVANQTQGNLHMEVRCEHAFHISSTVWEYYGSSVDQWMFDRQWRGLDVKLFCMNDLYINLPAHKAST